MTASDDRVDEPRPPKDGDDAERTEGELAPGRTGSSLPDDELDAPDDET